MPNANPPDLLEISTPLLSALTPLEIHSLVIAYSVMPVEYASSLPRGVMLPHPFREGWMMARDERSHVEVLRGAQ